MPDDQRGQIDAADAREANNEAASDRSGAPAAPSAKSRQDESRDREGKAGRGAGDEDSGKDEASDEGGGEKDDGERGKDGEENKPEPKKPSFIRRHPVWIVLGLIALAALAVAGYFFWLVFFYPYESTDDAFVDARSFAVSTKVSGFVAEVPVTDNQHVEPGGVIARIDPTDYQASLTQARTRVEAANASIESADAQVKTAKIAVEQAREELKSAEAALQFARDEEVRKKALVESGAGTVQASQQATTQLQQAQAEAAQAEARVNTALTGIDTAQAQKATAVANLHQAQAAMTIAQMNVGYTTLVAAQPGRVVRLSGAEGQYVDVGQSVAMFVPDAIWVTANFKETQITDMRPGQPVDIVLDAYPDHPLHGKVDSVQPGSGTAFSLLPAENATGNYVKVTQRVPVKIVVEKWPADVSIGPGMSVVPTVTVRPRQDDRR